ncbi:Methyl-accepting transducer domain-containing protein [Hyphomicrobiales bacterium]|nr:Methyl-accepting transducer domain-containing protein [Hyphomicrobiales bacterium]CAH1699619.1 Methyl-accepting transducer domain-containing protein [Hyphomicrobiales bacterium]CAI0343971.1 methyl-accepting chemotaxis protein [Hyphomicrobiales bacterium]
MRETIGKRARLAAWSGLVAAAIMAGTAGFALWQGRQTAVDVSRQQLSTLAALLSEQTHQTLATADLELRGWSEAASGADIASPEDFRAKFGTRQHFDALIERSRTIPQIAAVTIVDIQGEVVNSTRSFPPPPASLKDRGSFLVRLADPALGLYLAAPASGPSAAGRTMALSRNIRNRNGAVVGLAMVEIETGFLSAFYDKARANALVHIALFRRDGALLASLPNYDDAVARSPAGRSPLFRDLPDAAESSGAMFVGPHIAGPQDSEEGLISVQAVRGYPLQISIAAPGELVFHYWRKRALILGCIVAFFVFLISVLTFWIAKLLRQHGVMLSELAASEKTAADHMQELQIREGREALLRRDAAIKSRVTAFDAQLRSSLDRLGQMIESVASLSESMMAAAQQAREGSERAEAASGRTADHVASVAADAESMSSAGHEIAARVAASVSTAADVIAEADRTDLAIAQLAEATNQIDNVSALISEIASQTNLLALNATIEAARAGQAGRGFSVVASEVKSLSAQTSGATSEIGRQIEAIQMASQRCIEALQSIRGRMLDARTIGQSVSEGIGRQSRSTAQIALTIRAAAHDAQGALSSASAVRQAADLSNTSAADVMALARDLDGEARRIRNQVSEFFGTLDAA